MYWLLLPGSVSVCLCLLQEFPLLNCLEAEQPPSANQAEMAAHPATGIQDMPGGPHMQTGELTVKITRTLYLNLTDSVAH